MILPDIKKFYQDLGERVKTERLKRKVSQEELGGHLELTRTSIINLEKGRHRPTIYQLLLIADFFKINYAELIPVKTETKIEKHEKEKIDLTNAVADQAEFDETVVINFLSSINTDENEH